MHDEKDHLVHQIADIENQIKIAENWNTDLSRAKAELVLKLSELEVELKSVCEQNADELRQRLSELDEVRQLEQEQLNSQRKQESSLAIDLASTHEARSGVKRLRLAVEEKKKQLARDIKAHADEIHSLDSNTFALRMQLTEASRQKFRDVSNNLEANTTADMMETSKAATIRNTSLELELTDHSEEVMEMMTEYDNTEVKLVKMRRQRDFKRSALKLVEKRIAHFSQQAMEYGSIADETLSQIAELKQMEKKTEQTTVDELRHQLVNTKAEAVHVAKLVQQRYVSLAKDPLLGRSGLLEGETSEDVIYSLDEGTDAAHIDDIWNSSNMDMRDVCWT